MCLKNGRRKNAEVYCQLSQKDKQLVQLQNNVQIIYIAHSNHCTGGCRKKSKPNFLKTKQPFSFQGGGGILMGLFQSLNLDPRKLV